MRRFRIDLLDVFEIGAQLKNAEIMDSFARAPSMPDEPRICHWLASYRKHSGQRAGGLSTSDDRSALLATFAEALERCVWSEQTDYFISPTTASVKDIGAKGRFIHPERFAGFSKEQRASGRLALRDNAHYLWIKGYSWTQGGSVYLPAQTVSSAYRTSLRKRKNTASHEPLIRNATSTGLATHPDRTQAILSGALEVIERDAYMITWLNQLSPPHIRTEPLAAKNESLRELMTHFARYKLDVRAVRMITDAPTHAVCVVVEDRTGNVPRFSVGLKAHFKIDYAVEAAILEALRARRTTRHLMAQPPKGWDSAKVTSEVNHMERLLYWVQKDRHKMLEFLLSGRVEDAPETPWENDNAPAHLERIIQWCREKEYEIVSVDLGRSRYNPLPWKIEMVVIPELHPLHQNETPPCLYSERLSEIPRKFGYHVRKTPFTEHPHPFI